MARRKPESDGSPMKVQDYLSGVDYPVSKEELLNIAKRENAPEGIIRTLQNLPERKFRQPADVNRELGR